MNAIEFRQRVELGSDVDANTYLTRSVLTADHKKFLAENDFTLEDISRGRWNSFQEAAVYSFMESVNAVLGWKYYVIV